MIHQDDAADLFGVKAFGAIGKFVHHIERSRVPGNLDSIAHVNIITRASVTPHRCSGSIIKIVLTDQNKFHFVLVWIVQSHMQCCTAQIVARSLSNNNFGQCIDASIQSLIRQKRRIVHATFRKRPRPKRSAMRLTCRHNPQAVSSARLIAIQRSLGRLYIITIAVYALATRLELVVIR